MFLNSIYIWIHLFHYVGYLQKNKIQALIFSLLTALTNITHSKYL